MPDWKSCPGKDALMSVQDEINSMREDMRMLTQNVNNLTVTVAKDTTEIKGYIRELHNHNRLQNGHIRETKETMKKFAWGLAAILIMQILMVTGVVNTIHDFFGWLSKIAGLPLG